MEIWIRSQDKTSLVECKTIDVLNRFNEFHIVANYIDFGEVENYDDLGQYSSKRKQIKVLDMIQNHVETYSNKVFQMPQDDEVKA
ncbi:hypothetical protein [Thomasclavelia cocleata]|uniref:hypothetical protein n=1 Tax=Thomasclavelia cocleata TaxID=69824 RepID=UPI0025582F30|nr:hypothetical protein [Thomasclavelia cocleata]